MPVKLNTQSQFIGKDLSGVTFHHIEIISYAGMFTKPCGAKVPYWNCICKKCNAPKIASGSNIKLGKVCKCNRIKHGHSKRGNWSALYQCWSGIIQRSTNKRSTFAKRYVLRGIGVCRRWLKFENFLADMGPTWRKGLTIDRINNNKGYCKSNCKWSTRMEQSHNRENNIMLKLKGEVHCVSEWSRLLGIHANTIRARIRRGLSHEDTLTRPIRRITD